MAKYGTKEYYAEEVAQADMQVEMLCTALNVEAKDGTITRDKLYRVCKVYVEAYERLQSAQEAYNECVKDA